MTDNLGTLGLFVVLALIFPFLLIALPLVLRHCGVIPQHPSHTKQETYECGMKPLGDAWTQFNFHYYTFAILFVVLDIMALFLFPWAAHFLALSRSAKVYGLVGVIIFISILLIGFLYAWRKKALEWK
ncbi:MAG: NADH-quinone oxidoreductase subunit A [Dehalococcoidia bacterium]|nr:NADH-quinone oxidoreductase subunit A [Dehalococcoidia bacterium]